MKINNIQQVSKIYGAAATRKVSAKTNREKEKDKFEISTTARHYQTGLNAVKNTPDIRQEKVDRIKKQMESGTYNVSAEEVAKKMMAEFFDHSI